MKKIVALIIALACVLALTGCGVTNRGLRRAYNETRPGTESSDFYRSRRGEYKSDAQGRVAGIGGARKRAKIVPPTATPSVTPGSVLPKMPNVPN